MKTLMWYTKGLNSYLCQRGFGHYFDNEPVSFDFKEGRAFFFDGNKKTFGLVDIIPNDKSDLAKKLTAEYRESGEIKLVEDSIITGGANV